MIDSQLVNILVVDDDDVDIKGIRRAFAKADIQAPVIAAGDGFEALDLLRGDVGDELTAGPTIIVLDLNMPKMNGIEFLHALRADERLHHHVVFVLTTSADERDQQQAYAAHAAGYFVKSDMGRGFKRFVDFLHGYLDSVQLPHLVRPSPAT